MFSDRRDVVSVSLRPIDVVFVNPGKQGSGEKEAGVEAFLNQETTQKGQVVVKQEYRLIYRDHKWLVSFDSH